ncbi:MAG: hypothetical protein ACRDLP_02260 [Solirubrobacteraceae bacterium]
MSTLAALASDFAALERDGPVYLDSAASPQKPREVIDATMVDFAVHNTRADVNRLIGALEGARESFGG